MSRITLAMTAAALTMAAHAAQATGFFVNQQDVRSLGRVNAGAAAAADGPGTIFFNPAGLVYLWSADPPGESASRMAARLNVVVPKSAFTDDGSEATTPGTGGLVLPSAGRNFKDPADVTPVPYFYQAHRLGPGGSHVGFGINVPFGQTVKFSPDWFGRYDATEAQLKTLNLSAVGAYAPVTGLAIGGGIDLQVASTKLVAAIPNPLAPGGPSAATDGRSETRGDGWSLGYNLGAMVDLTGKTRLGVSYRSAMKPRLSGTVSNSGLTGPLATGNGSIGASFRLKLPSILGVGIVSRPTEKLSLYAQYDRFGWNSFDQILVTLDNGASLDRQTHFRNAWALSAGLEYAISDQLALRGGIRFDRTPTVDGFRDTNVPDADRVWLGTGASYRWSTASTIDVALSYIRFKDATVDVTRAFFEGTPLSTTTRVRGTTRSRVGLLSVSWSHAF